MRRSKGLHATKRIAQGLKAKRKSYKLQVGALPSNRKGLEAQGSMSHADICLEDSVLMLMKPENEERKAAEAAYEQAKKNDPKGLHEQLSGLLRKGTLAAATRTMINLLIKDLQRQPNEPEGEQETNEAVDPEELSLKSKTKSVKRMIKNLSS